MNQWQTQTSGEYVSAFVKSVVGALQPGPVGDDTLPFWRAQWAAKHGTVAVTTRPSKAQESIAAAQRVLARVDKGL